MFTVKVRFASGKVEEHNIDKPTSEAARIAAAHIPGAMNILSCEKTFAPPKKGAAVSATVAEAAERLRQALKAEYGVDFAFEVFGKGAIIAASSFDHGTVVPQVKSQALAIPA